jgi:hypothetical protein
VRRKPLDLRCPVCNFILTKHFHRTEKIGWDICGVACGFVTCIRDEITVNLKTGEVRNTPYFAYNA